MCVYMCVCVCMCVCAFPCMHVHMCDMCVLYVCLYIVWFIQGCVSSVQMLVSLLSVPPTVELPMFSPS